MILTPDSLVSTHDLRIEVDGEFPILLELNTETGEAKTYARDNKGGILLKDGEIVVESMMIPVDKLHVYLVKPKVS